VTHFFLDCFEESDVVALARKIAKASQPEALWLISEFRETRWTRPVLTLLYTFFRLSTGLKTRRLVDYRDIVEAAGFRLRRREYGMAGLLVSELWERAG
jgi:tRNA (cmo5U34)-methyltransferase